MTLKGLPRNAPWHCLKKIEDCGEDGVDNVTGQKDDYVVVVKTCCCFDLCIRILAYGASSE
jgi:hypothetical protein